MEKPGSSVIRYFRYALAFVFVFFLNVPSAVCEPVNPRLGAASKALAPAVVVDSDLDSKNLSMRRHLMKLLAAKDFKALDELAADMRANPMQMPDGESMLDYFYKSFVWERRLHNEILSQEDVREMLIKMIPWTKSRPESITPRIITAKLFIKEAWIARGGGYAGSVSADGWAKMKQDELAALSILTEAQKLKLSCPYWYYLMLTLAKDQSWPPQRSAALLSEGLAKYPYYKPLYFMRCVDLQPRWGGAPGEWETTMNKWADKLGGIEGDKLYAQMVWYIDSTHWYSTGDGRTTLFTDFRLEYPRIKRGMEALLKQYPTSVSLLSEYCHLACAAGDAQEAVKLFANLGGCVDLDAWGSKLEFDQYRNTFLKPHSQP